VRPTPRHNRICPVSRSNPPTPFAAPAASSCRADVYLRFLWRFLPAFCLGNSLISLSFLDQLPLIDATCDAYAGVFKSIEDYKPYDAFDNRATGYNIAYMAVLCPAYLALAILIDVALANPHVRLALSGGGLRAKAAALAAAALAAVRGGEEPGGGAGADAEAAAALLGLGDEDADVAAERRRVDAAAAAAAAGGGAEQVGDVIQLRSLRKVFYSNGAAAARPRPAAGAAGAGAAGAAGEVVPSSASSEGGADGPAAPPAAAAPRAKVAVRSLSFGVSVGEVFGFLGINGAGKTTTLQMLSGDVLPSAGTALLCGYDILREQQDVRRTL